MKTQIGYALSDLTPDPAELDDAPPRDDDELSLRATQPWVPSPAANARAKLRRFDHIEILRASQAGIQRIERAARTQRRRVASAPAWVGLLMVALLALAVLGALYAGHML